MTCMDDLDLCYILLNDVPSAAIADAIEHRQEMKREALTTYTDYLEYFND